jgi:hypothetical protein
LWYVSLFALLVPFNNSLLNLLGAFFYADRPNIAITTTELINVSISGWAIFTIFVRIDTDGIIPSEAVRKTKYEKQKLLNAMFFVPSARTSTYLLLFILNDKSVFEFFGIEINSYLALFITVCFSLVFGTSLYRLSKKRKIGGKRINQESSTIYPPEVQQALSKFATRLNEDEQSELSVLTLHTEKINKVTFINLVKICWNGLVLAWLFEVCVELIQRL